MDQHQSLDAESPTQTDQLNPETEAPSGYEKQEEQKNVQLIFEEAKASFLSAKSKIKDEIANEENEVPKRVYELVSEAGAALRDEQLAHESFVKQINQKLQPERLRLSQLKSNLNTLKDACTTKGNISAGALDEVVGFGQAIQKQTDYLTKVEVSCDKQIKAENSRYYQKRTEIWMEILPKIEQIEGSKKEFFNSRFCELQNLAQTMNKARKSLQVGTIQEKAEQCDVHMQEDDKENNDAQLVGTEQNETDDDIIEFVEH